jgi:hypothetical protein
MAESISKHDLEGVRSFCKLSGWRQEPPTNAKIEVHGKKKSLFPTKYYKFYKTNSIMSANIVIKYI